MFQSPLFRTEPDELGHVSQQHCTTPQTWSLGAGTSEDLEATTGMAALDTGAKGMLGAVGTWMF